MEIVCLILGLSVIGFAGFSAWKQRHNTQKWITYITLGVFLATFFMVLPTQWVKEGKEVFCKPLYAALSSLLYSLKTLGGRQDLAQLETIDLPGILKCIYILASYICFALAPVLASSLLLSFMGDTGDRIRFTLTRNPKCCIFSEINEKALALAAGVSGTANQAVIVFSNGKNADKQQVAKAKNSVPLCFISPAMV